MAAQKPEDETVSIDTGVCFNRDLLSSIYYKIAIRNFFKYLQINKEMCKSYKILAKENGFSLIGHIHVQNITQTENVEVGN